MKKALNWYKKFEANSSRDLPNASPNMMTLSSMARRKKRVISHSTCEEAPAKAWTQHWALHLHWSRYTWQPALFRHTSGQRLKCALNKVAQQHDSLPMTHAAVKDCVMLFVRKQVSAVLTVRQTCRIVFSIGWQMGESLPFQNDKTQSRQKHIPMWR